MVDSQHVHAPMKYQRHHVSLCLVTMQTGRLVKNVMSQKAKEAFVQIQKLESGLVVTHDSMTIQLEDSSMMV
jgi:hypothetical protein